MDLDYVCALACLCDTIPGFDISSFTNKDTAPPKAQHTLASTLFSKIVQDMEVHFDMTITQKEIFECLGASHMSPMEYHAILKYRLMIPSFPADKTCPICHKACLDAFW